MSVRPLLTLAFLLALPLLALGGDDDKDIEITEAWRLQQGSVVHVGRWTAGRGHQPGQSPSLSAAGDGRTWTYHTPSPEVGWVAFTGHLSQAAGRTATGWANACTVSAPFCSWLSALPSDELAMAHQQALYWCDAN